MKRSLVRLLCVAAVIAVLIPAATALGQSTLRTNIRGGDVYQVTDAGGGGFVEILISWTKKADFDLVVQADSGDGEPFVVCLGFSFQDGFERCHFGQGHLEYFVTIQSFTGAKRAKGAIWVSFTDEDRAWARTEGSAEQGLRYVGNLDEPGDDPILQRLAQDSVRLRALKTAPAR